MSNLSTIIEDLRKQYTQIQAQYQFQLEQLIKINEEMRADAEKLEIVNEHVRQENLRLKADNKQLHGEKTILFKELDEQFQPPQTFDDAVRIISNYRNEVVKLLIANQALNRQHMSSLDTITHLQNKYQTLKKRYQEAAGANAVNNDDELLSDQLVIKQSLESELERERKVREEIESSERELKTQLKSVKEKGKTVIDSLKQKLEQTEAELKKSREDSAELQNQIQSLKKDSKNSLSVQEDLVRLIQSLQIELNQIKQDQMASNTITIVSGDSSSSTGATAVDPSLSKRLLQVRCQHEDDFNECASCKAMFSVTKRKHRCKHCCKIYCADCCNKVIFSGPNLRPHKVCVSCHTFLDTDTQPATASAQS